MKKLIVIIIVLSALGVIGFRIYQKISITNNQPERRRGNAAVAVEIKPIESVTIREIGAFTGTLQAFSKFVIAPKVSGRLEKLFVNIGDYVEDGQVVAILEDAEYHQQVIQTRADLEVTRAGLEERNTVLEKVRREYERTNSLRKKKIASVSELDAALSDYNAELARRKVVIAQVAQKEAALKTAEVRMAYTTIRVPQTESGQKRVIGRRFVDEGAMLSANSSLASILDISRLIAVINVIERDYSKIQKGLSAKIMTDAYPERTFTGKIVRIAPLLSETSREARIEIEISNPENLLKPGMFIKTRIQFEVHENATVVPVEAIIRKSENRGIFIADLATKTARFVPVTLGIINDDLAEILEPPISGSVVTLGQHLLEDGAPIILPDQNFVQEKPIEKRSKSSENKSD
jgi:RND family efflux transporter MFP subunit